jgi:hypothetical protein
MSERGSQQRADFRSLVGEAWSRLLPFMTRVFEYKELLERAAFVPSVEPTELATVARLVATASTPPRPGEIAARTGCRRRR